MTSLKKLIVGTVIASTALTAAVALAETSTSSTMTLDEAKTIAQTGVCAQAGTLKGTGFYNAENKTWWVDLSVPSKEPQCAPACVINAETKTIKEVNWRCTGLILPKKNEKKILDPACLGAAVAKRETAVASAFSAKSTAVSAALTKRASDLSAAWAMTVVKDRNAAIKAAWKAFNASATAARKAYRTTNSGVWKTFRTDAKACYGNQWQDSSQQGIDNNL